MDELIEGDDTAQAAIGWPRAILTGFVVVALGVALLAYGTNELLTRLTSLDRSQRVGAATAYFFVVLGGFAWGLRRLQRRSVI